MGLYSTELLYYSFTELCSTGLCKVSNGYLPLRWKVQDQESRHNVLLH